MNFMKRLFLKLLVIFLLLINNTYSSGPQLYSKYILQPSSMVGFKGSSTINTFLCGSGFVSGEGKGIASTDSMVYLKNEASVSLMVESLDCGTDLMNVDMFNALKSDTNPLIEFKLLKVKSIEVIPESKNIYRVETMGNMFVAGVRKEQQMAFIIESLSNENYRVTGNKKLSMSEFDILPPTAFFGLIRANDSLEVFFDLNVVVQNEIADSHTKDQSALIE